MSYAKKLEKCLNRWAQLAAQRNAYDHGLVKRLRVGQVGDKTELTAEFRLPVMQCDTHGFHMNSNMLHTAVVGTLITDCSLLTCHAFDPLERSAVTTDIGFSFLNSSFEDDE